MVATVATTVSKKEMVLAILKALRNNPKNPENLNEFKSFMNKSRENLAEQYELSLKFIAKHQPIWDREEFLGHKDYEIILCQCGNRLTQGELFKDSPNYRTESVACPKCHLQTLRYQRKSERYTEQFTERLTRDVECITKEQAEWAAAFLADPVSRLEWAMGIFDNSARKREAQLILNCMKEIAEGKYTLADLIKNIRSDALLSAKFPSYSTSVTSNLMHQSRGAAAAYYLEQLERLQEYTAELDSKETQS